jgi:hypothetical protein
MTFSFKHSAKSKRPELSGEGSCEVEPDLLEKTPRFSETARFGIKEYPRLT